MRYFKIHALSVLKAYSPVRPRVEPVTCCLSGRQCFSCYSRPYQFRVAWQVKWHLREPHRGQCNNATVVLVLHSADRPPALTLWLYDGDAAVSRRNSLQTPSPKKLFGKGGVEKLRWLLLLLAPSSPNLVVVGVPTLLNPFLTYTVCVLPTASDKTISYWDL